MDHQTELYDTLDRMLVEFDDQVHMLKTKLAEKTSQHEKARSELELLEARAEGEMCRFDNFSRT